MKARRALIFILAVWYVLLWVGGVGTYLAMDRPPSHVAWAAPTFLLTAAVLVLVTASPREAALLAACGILGWCAEVIGVKTGLPFGGYTYTAVLGPGWLSVPFAMAAAWVLLAAYGRFMGGTLGLCGMVLALAGAAWMVGMDAVIDPLAGGDLGFWVWEGHGVYYGIPASNFLGWFVVSAVLLGLLAPIRHVTVVHGAVGLSLLLFFTVLAATRGMLLAALAGSVLVVVHGVVTAGRRRASASAQESPQYRRDIE